MNKYRAIYSATLCLSFITLQSCIMYMPAARDDYSGLPNDQLSEIVREGKYDKEHPRRGSVGYQALDSKKMKKLAQNHFLGKEQVEIEQLFNEYQDTCNSSKSSTKITEVLCTADRQWKLKNIGATFDTKDWAEPGVRLNFRFQIDARKMVENLELTIKDISIYK